MSNEDTTNASIKLCRDCKWVSGALLDNIAGCEAPENESTDRSFVTGDKLYRYSLAKDAREALIRFANLNCCGLAANWFQPRPALAQRIIAEAQPRTQVKPAHKIGIDDL